MWLLPTTLSGRVAPYSPIGSHATDIDGAPSNNSIFLMNMSGRNVRSCWLNRGAQSTTRNLPLAQVNSMLKTLVFLKYCCRVVKSPTGWMENSPPLVSSSNGPNTNEESNRGQQSHFTEAAWSM